MRNTRSNIYLDHLKHNFSVIKSLIPAKTRICLAVKADGYGHGAVHVAKTAEQEGITWFGIANIDEGIELREAGIQSRILLFSLIPDDDIHRLLEYNITPVAADLDFIRTVENAVPPRSEAFPVHCFIDTGMGRIGCFPEDAPKLAEAVTKSDKLFLEGMCTHFARADSSDQRFTKRQLDRFITAIEAIRELGIHPGMLHAANSGAIIGVPQSHLDMVRPGIMAYGYYPSREQERTLDLKPVMELQSRVSFIKEVGPDTPISYGSTYRTKGKTRIATVAAGYGDGYFRNLSNKGKVFIRDRLYPLVGTVTMDQIMVDLGTQSEVRVGDTAVLFGPGPGGVTAEDLADLCNTISYEITCSVSKRVAREYSSSPSR